MPELASVIGEARREARRRKLQPDGHVVWRQTALWLTLQQPERVLA